MTIEHSYGRSHTITVFPVSCCFSVITVIIVQPASQLSNLSSVESSLVSAVLLRWTYHAGGAHGALQFEGLVYAISNCLLELVFRHGHHKAHRSVCVVLLVVTVKETSLHQCILHFLHYPVYCFIYSHHYNPQFPATHCTTGV